MRSLRTVSCQLKFHEARVTREPLKTNRDEKCVAERSAYGVMLMKK